MNVDNCFLVLRWFVNVVIDVRLCGVINFCLFIDVFDVITDDGTIAWRGLITYIRDVGGVHPFCSRLGQVLGGRGSVRVRF